MRVIIIIGAGAAGCFCAINLKRLVPEAEVIVCEAHSKPLAKVAITGGGRCNLTNSFRLITDLRQAYPRGDKLMRRALARFSQTDTMQWFEQEGVRLVTQDDECVFPRSQSAMEVVTTLRCSMHCNGVQLLLQRVAAITATGCSKYLVTLANGSQLEATHVVVTTGGHPTLSGFQMLNGLQVDIIPPVPSLFTFNIASKREQTSLLGMPSSSNLDEVNIEGDWKQDLMGTVVEHTAVSLAGTKFKAHGPLLFTHWGMSGPAILRLSSYAARHLAECNYRATLCVNWLGEQSEGDVRTWLERAMHSEANKQITNHYPTALTQRHWTLLLQRAAVPLTQRWGALTVKHLNRLTTVLTADTYQITGRCPFKEEFVTCGGVSLQSVNSKTLEAKHHPGLYFAGEVLDIDAITGGFNLQAAWSTAHLVAESIAQQATVARASGAGQPPVPAGSIGGSHPPKTPRP